MSLTFLLYLSGFKWKTDVSTPMEIDDFIDVDANHNNPQFCTTLACDIYRHLRIAEVTILGPTLIFLLFSLLMWLHLS